MCKERGKEILSRGGVIRECNLKDDHESFFSTTGAFR